MIDLTINKTGLEHNIQKAKENHIIIPTIAQMQHPETIPGKIQDQLKNVGLWDINPLNLFRITWKNEAKEFGGLYQPVPTKGSPPVRPACSTACVWPSCAMAVCWRSFPALNGP